MTSDEYKALAASQHRNRERFALTIESTVSSFVRAQSVLRGLVANFDIDDEANCEGVNLDILGQWIGRTRLVSVPIEGVFFTWDDTPGDGWDAGRWQGEFESGSATRALPDYLYRKILRGKIAANNWKGDRAGQYKTLMKAFDAAGQILIVDNQDMTQTVLVSTGFLSTIERALLEQELIPIRPAGVGMNFDFDFFFSPFEFSLFVPGLLSSGQVTFRGFFDTNIVLREGWGAAHAETPFTADNTISVYRGDDVSPFATIFFAAGSGVGVCTLSTGLVTIVPTDLIEFRADTAADATGGGLSISVVATYVIG